MTQGDALRIKTPHGGLDQRPVEWSPELEQFLFENGVQASDKAQDSLRGAYLLLQNVQAADARWGTDYVNAVLHKLLKTLYPKQPVIQGLLLQVPAYGLSRSSALAECREFLGSCLRGSSHFGKADLYFFDAFFRRKRRFIPVPAKSLGHHGYPSCESTTTMGSMAVT